MSLRSRLMKSGVLGLLVAAAVGSTAIAQEEGGRGRGPRGGFGFGGGGGGMELMLLQNEQVQKELDLADEQKSDLTRIAEEARAGRGEGRRGEGGGFDAEAFQARMEEIRKKVDEVLLPEQRERLQQITIQVQGTQALSSRRVAEELGLSEDQQAQIREARRSAFGGGRGEGNRGPGNFNPEERQKRMAEADEKVLAVLTAEQKEKFENMKGEKFELDRRALFGRGRGGDRGGDRGPRGGDR